MKIIGVKEVMQHTGLTYRQIDYWCRQGVIRPLNTESVSIGFAREFDESMLERIRVLATISTACKNRLALEILREIYDNYEAGHIYLGPGIVLKWRTEDDHNGQASDTRSEWHDQWRHG